MDYFIPKTQSFLNAGLEENNAYNECAQAGKENACDWQMMRKN